MRLGALANQITAEPKSLHELGSVPAGQARDEKTRKPVTCGFSIALCQGAPDGEPKSPLLSLAGPQHLVKHHGMPVVDDAVLGEVAVVPVPELQLVLKLVKEIGQDVGLGFIQLGSGCSVWLRKRFAQVWVTT